MKRAWALLLLVSAPPEERVWEQPEAGFRLAAPADWAGASARSPSDRTVRFHLRHPKEPRVSFVVAAWDEGAGTTARAAAVDRPSALRDRYGFPVDLLSQRSLEVDGEPAAAGTYRLRDPSGGSIMDEVIVGRDGVGYLLTSSAPAAAWEEHRPAFRCILESFRWMPIPGRPPDPVRVSYEPIAGRTVVLVPDDSDEAFLSAIPAAAMLNRGRPVVLAVGAKMSGPVARFLRRYRPQVVAVGLNAGDVPGRSVRRASELWRKPRAAILADGPASGAVAAPVAARMGCPLLFSAEEVRALDPQKVYVAGGAEYPGAQPLEFPRGDFVAVANLRGRHRNHVLAALLAAARGGSVVLIDEEVRTLFAPLRDLPERPAGIDESKAGRYLVGEILGVRVAVPVLSSRPVNLGIRDLAMSDSFYGDPSFDLDRSGRFDDGERRLFAETVELDGRRWSIVERLESFVGNLARGAAGENLLGLVSPPAAEVHRKLLREYGAVPKHVALVGTADEIPFHYVRSDYYFLAQGWTSPVLASDAPYANADGDGYLEIAVGRLPLERRDEGSAIVATAIAYDELSAAPRAVAINPGFPKLDRETGWPSVIPDAEATMRAVEREFAGAGVPSVGFYRESATLERCLPEIGAATFLFYENHAGPETWSFGPSTLVPRWSGRIFADPPASIRALPELAGEPFVFCGGCLSGGIDLGVPFESCFPTAFLRSGAAAYAGNTRFGLGGTTGHTLRRAVRAMLYEGATIGEAMRLGKNRLWFVAQNGSAAGTGPYLSREQLVEGYHTLTLFGDPSIRPGLSARAPFDLSFRSTDETHAAARVRWTGAGWTYDVLTTEGKDVRTREVRVRAGQGLEHAPYNRSDLLPATMLAIPAPDGARSAAVRVSKGPPWMLRSWELADGELFVELAFLGSGEVSREAELEIEYSPEPPAAPRRLVVERDAFRLTLPSDEWKLRVAEGGIYVLDATQPLACAHVSWWENAGYAPEDFPSRRPEDFRGWYPESKVLGSGRVRLAGRDAPWVEYDVTYPGMGRYRTREIFVSTARFGVIVTLYRAWGSADGRWEGRALRMLEGFALKR